MQGGLRVNKKRLTLLLDDRQIRIIKSRAALAGMTGSQWVISQLNLDTAQGDTSTLDALAGDAEKLEYTDGSELVQDTPRKVDIAAVKKKLKEAMQKTPAALVDLVPDYTGKIMPKAERDDVLLQLDAAMTDDTPEAAQGIVDLLTLNAIPTDPRKNCYRIDWTYKKFRDLVNKIKNREKNR
jgi:hypothetical protein